MVDDHHLYLIRHLPTAGNEKRRYIGWTDEPIVSGHGRSRLHSFGNVETVYGSDLLRARQSAAVYFPEAAYVADSRWRECHFGEFEGKTYAELEMDEDYRAWLDDPRGVAPRGGERLAEVEARVRAALVDVPSGSIVVTHGGPIRSMLSCYSADGPAEFWTWSVPHGSVWKLVWRDYEDVKEGLPCISLSEVPITENGNS
ncbi:histidine phosphatase family protein [Sporosarcina sp. Te-1]|uniref:histidine phosphatase family protein n=1 Tax=Sporosarcina sp. Te-1 TaxID=2818390 RepID=UPI001A9E6719|nr:histidine phosphatase family protein [Sporosarcina sp. Te-1]QTD40726.1 histidine phosphatase family protein [Sporosarcina sp. Te-1]